jgi:hypothetical protein
MGSSGSESTVRHKVHEARLISAALDAIAVKEGIGRFHLVGNSGGAIIVGALLASRQDIGCAVLGSGRLTLPAAAKILDTRKPLSEEVADSYLNDANYAGEIPNDPNLRVFVLTDPLDKLSAFDGQNEFVRRAKGSGVPIVQLLTSSIVDNGEHHDVQRQANDVLQLCIDGKPDAFIATKIQEASEINKAAWAAAK